MNRTRSFMKALTYRVLGTLISMIGLAMVGGDLAAVFAVGIGETVVKVFVYYLHERAWAPWSMIKSKP